MESILSKKMEAKRSSSQLATSGPPTSTAEIKARNSLLQSFDLSKHVAPKYTITGVLIGSTKQLKGRTLDKDAKSQKIPSNWVKPGSEPKTKVIKTKTALEQARSMQKIPHHSYDLDGDGGVSHRDYFLAKQFDKDQDGKLNDKELAEARKSLKDGFSQKFLFGLEASANRLSYNSLLPGYDYERRHAQKTSNHLNHVRVLQKNGKPLIGEDFTPLAPYPPRPPKAEGYRTQTEMKEDKKAKDLKTITAHKDRFESETLKMLQEQQQVWSSVTPKQKNPTVARTSSLKTRIQTIKQEERREHRARQGLLIEPRELKKAAELSQSERKEVKTTKQLMEKRFKLDNKDINQKTVSGQAKKQERKKLKDADERHREPEQYSIYDQPAGGSGQFTLTKRQVQNQRMQLLMEKNQATFGKPKYGLHGKPLPNFFYKSSSEAQLAQKNSKEDGSSVEVAQPSQKTIEWWRSQDGFEQTPKYVSNREIRQKMKHWVKPDPFYLNDFKKEEPETDNFKKNRILKFNKDDHEKKWEKPNAKPLSPNTNYMKDEQGVSRHRAHKSARFSDTYSRPSKRAQQSQQSLDQSHEAYFANMPLFSSFNSKQVFPRQPGDKHPAVVATGVNDYLPSEPAQQNSVHSSVQGGNHTKQGSSRKESMVTIASAGISNNPSALVIRTSNTVANFKNPQSNMLSLGVNNDLPLQTSNQKMTTLFDRVVRAVGKSPIVRTIKKNISKESLHGLEQAKEELPGQARTLTTNMTNQSYHHITMPKSVRHRDDGDGQLQSVTDFKKTTTTGVRSSGFSNSAFRTCVTSLEGTMRHQATPEGSQDKEEFVARTILSKKSNKTINHDSQKGLIAAGSILSSQHSSHFNK